MVGWRKIKQIRKEDRRGCKAAVHSIKQIINVYHDRGKEKKKKRFLWYNEKTEIEDYGRKLYRKPGNLEMRLWYLEGKRWKKKRWSRKKFWKY